jgi:cell division protein ZapD
VAEARRPAPPRRPDAWDRDADALAEALSVLLGLLRDSGVPQQVARPAASTSKPASGRTYQLMRVRIDRQRHAGPEISGHRLMASVRLMRQDAEAAEAEHADTTFELTLCA